MCDMARPTQSMICVSLQVNRFQKFILLIVQYKYLKSCSKDFSPRIWSSAQDYAVLGLLLNLVVFWISAWQKSVRRKWFVLAVYQFWKGISAGPAHKYFTWFIGAGGHSRTHFWMWYDSVTRGVTYSHVWHESFTCSRAHSCLWHDLFISVTWLIHTCDVTYSRDTHSYVWYDSLTCGIAHSYVRHESFTWDLTHSGVTWLNHMTHLHVTWPIRTCDMTHSYMCHDSFMCVTWHMHMWRGSFICIMVQPITWHIHMRDMTHLHVTWLIQMTWLIHIFDMTRLYVWHNSCTCDITHSNRSWSSPSHHQPNMTWRLYMWHDSFACDMTHSSVWHDSFTCDMTRLYGSWSSPLLYKPNMTHMTWRISMRDILHSYAAWFNPT